MLNNQTALKSIRSDCLLSVIGVALLCLCFAANVFATTVTATVDRTKIANGDSFNLTLTVSGSDQEEVPDLSPLQDNFSILSTSKSSQVSFINGKSSSLNQWILELTPKKTGTLIIPSLQFGQSQSNSIKINVSENKVPASSSHSKAVFLETSVNNQQPYIQSQIVYTVRLFYSTDIASGQLTDPKVDNAVVIRLGEDKHYQADRYARLYQVVERRYAIFPQHSGKMQIAPPVFSGLLSTPVNINRLDAFMQQRNRNVHIVAPSVSLTVKSLPKSLKSSYWLPAQKLSLTETWSVKPLKFKVGDPITRTITISADGLSASQLPDLTQQTIDGIKAYPDQPVSHNKIINDKVIGERIEKVAYIPTKTGAITLPAINIKWWNVKTNQFEAVSLPARTANVLASNGKQSDAAASLSDEPVSQSVDKPAANVANLFQVSAHKLEPWQWQWLLLFLAVGLICIAAWLTYRKKFSSKLTESKADENRLTTVRQSLKQLQSACNDNNPRQAKHVLLRWSEIKWPNSNIKNLPDVAKLIHNKQLKQQIEQLDKILYADSLATWQGDKLWKSFKLYRDNKLKQKNRTDKTLPPLYPH